MHLTFFLSPPGNRLSGPAILTENLILFLVLASPSECWKRPCRPFGPSVSNLYLIKGRLCLKQWMRLSQNSAGRTLWAIFRELRSHVPQATKPARHNYWACTPQLGSLRAANYRAHVLWNPSATTTEPTCPGTCAPQLRENPHATTREKLAGRNEDPSCCN